MFKVKLLILGSIAVSVFSVNTLVQAASTYYVDNTNSSASDSNAGTISAPWRTIGKAAIGVSAGDTVIVKAGTYNERVTLSRAGAVSGKITFKSDQKWGAKMLGFNMNAPYNRVEGFDISNSTKNYAGGTGVFVSANNSEVVGNYIHDSYAGVARFGNVSSWVSNVYVVNNVIRNIGTIGIIASGNNWLVENNEVDRLYDGDSSQDSDYSRFFGNNITFRGNYFHGTKESEIGGAHTDCFQTYDNNGEYVTNLLIENNRCIGFFHEGLMSESGFSATPSKDWVIRNNVFTDGTSWALNFHGIDNVKILNNTFINIAANGVGFLGPKSNVPYSNRKTTGVISNNIFYNTGSWQGAVYFANGGTINEAKNNLVFKSGTTLPQSAFPNDVINKDPKFSALATGDYSLAIGSPAIDAGANLSAFNYSKDLSGTVRPQGAGWDIGAYERISAPLPTADALPPVVVISSPTIGTSFTTNNPQMSLAGTAVDNVGVSLVIWLNNKGGSGIAQGTENWLINSINLSVGENVVTVTAIDAAGNSQTDSLSLIYATPAPTPTQIPTPAPTASPTIQPTPTVAPTATPTTAPTSVPADTYLPHINVSSPTKNSVYSTSKNVLTVGGQASDNVAISRVVWTSSTGPGGTAIGTNQWSVSGIGLERGVNTLRFTAYDMAGNYVTDTLSVTCTAPIPTPSPKPTPTPKPTPIPTPIPALDTESPIVAWLNLVANQRLSNIVSIPVKARDNVGISSIQLFVTGNPVGTATVSPFDLVWDTRTVKNGSYKLQAVAKDFAGNTRRTAEVWVQVRN